MRASSSLAIVVLIILVPFSPAHGEGYRWWHDAVVQRALRLTPQQVSGIEAVFRKTLPERESLSHDLDRLEAQRDEVIRRADDDDASAIALITELESTRARRNSSRTLMLLRMYRLLSVEQRGKLLRLQQRAKNGRSSAEP